MSTVLREARGRPLTFFACVIASWICFRVVLFEPLWPPVYGSPPRILESLATVDPAPRVEDRRKARASIRDGGESELARWPVLIRALGQTTVAEASSNAMVAPGSVDERGGQDRRQQALPAPRTTAQRGAPPLMTGGSFAPPKMLNAPSARRWRADAWLLLRSGGASLASSGQQLPSYGASQVGAVLSYRLASRSAGAPTLYLRASHALIAHGESEAAMGLSARPLPAWPVTAHAELRATRRTGGSELRPAVFVTSGGELSGLPLGLAIRGYAAGGYVGGDFATAFVDGQAVADRKVAAFDRATLRVGGGAWGGAQHGAARLDLGPTASLEMQLSEVPIRLSLDYRRRVAGDAAPASGAALTLSTGF